MEIQPDAVIILRGVDLKKVDKAISSVAAEFKVWPRIGCLWRLKIWVISYRPWHMKVFRDALVRA